MRVRFGAGVPEDSARQWEGAAGAFWGRLEGRFGEAHAPELRVEVAEPSSMLGEAGRERAGLVRLSRLLAKGEAEPVLLHELAHAYLESRCSELARAAPVVSEAFALFASGDAARRALAGERFAFVTEARDFLVSREGSARGHEPPVQEALSRVLSQPGADASWEGWFQRTLGSCAGAAFSAARSHAELFERLRLAGGREPAPRVDFLLVDGLSQRTLAREGRVDEPAPVGSLLKPSLLATVPRLLEPRPAREAPEWHCPDAPVAGEEWTWRRALVRSCNGFFLDFRAEGRETFRDWADAMRLLGMAGVPDGMPGRIGLTSGTRLSPAQVVRLYSWLAAGSPFVVDALRDTARDGTLASSPDAAWFLERGIALKTGTVRDARSSPHDAWIAAVGERLPGGEVAFVAALHATGMASPALLPHLRQRLERYLPARPAGTRVQVLGLSPFASVSLSCAEGVPLLVRAPEGGFSLLPAGTVIDASGLLAGARYACAGSPLTLGYTSSRGSRSTRRYAGILEVDAPEALASAGPASSVPLRERSARARRGSRLVLVTSEREYVESTLLSEHAGGSPEVLKALALVVRHDLLVSRHEGRPPCDTTHCHLFGQEDEATVRTAGGRVHEAVSAVEGLALVPRDGEARWLEFQVGGTGRWTRRIAAAELRQKLGLPSGPTRVATLSDGRLELDAQRFPCELVRNQLRLPSCPDHLAADGDTFSLSGSGEGHGSGLDLTEAERLAASGASFRDLLARSYPEVAIAGR